MWSCGTKSLGLSSGKNGLLLVWMIWWDFCSTYSKMYWTRKEEMEAKLGVHNRNIHCFLMESKKKSP